MRLRTALVCLALALALTSCTAAPSPAVSTSAPPVPTAAETPTPEPEPEPVLVPSRLLDGDCDALLPADARPAGLGAITPAATPGWTPIGTLGGISCSYAGDTWVGVRAIPRALAPDVVVDRYREQVCEDIDDGRSCSVGRETADAWALVRVGSEPSALLDETADVVAAALATASPGVPADRTAGWWPKTSCEDLGSRIDLAAVFGADAFEAGYPGHAGRDVFDDVVEGEGVALGYCTWYVYVGEDVRTMRFWAYPGGGWDAGAQTAAIGAAQSGPGPDAVGVLDVAPGVEATMAEYVDRGAARRQEIWLSDGVNLVNAELRSTQQDVAETMRQIVAALRG